MSLPRNYYKLTLLVFLLLGCYATTEKKKIIRATDDSLAYYPPTPPKVSKQEFRRCYREAKDFYENVLERSRFNGAMLVAKNGEIVYEKYAGFQHMGQKDSITANTPFHLASVSKTFTGMATLKLWEEGKLQLQDEVSKYLTGFPFAGVTIKTLLNHRSGLPNYVYFMEQLGWDRKKTISNQDVLQFMIDHKQQLNEGKPDRHFSYCNTNYALLALIIEKVSGKTYADYLKETFFTPLKMENTFVFSMDKADSVMPSYNWRNRKEAFTFLDAVYGDKNIYSTPRDLLKWDAALSYSSLFKPSTLDSAYSGYSFERPGIKNYGLGWRMYIYPNNKKIIYHNGWWHGNNTVFTRLVQDSATIIILGNRYNRRIYDAKKLYASFGKYDGTDDSDE
jgi:CubicO group peptidase (beta-lactamase class C family)